MTALGLDVHVGHVQGAIAYIANRKRAIRAAAGADAAKGGRTRHGQLTRGGVAEDLDAYRAGRIIAAHCDGRELGAETAGLKANGHGQSIAWPDCDRVGQHFRNQEVAGIGGDAA